MRVLLVHNNSRVTGGAEVFFYQVGRVLVENGHQVAYFSCAEEGAETSEWSKYHPKVVDYRGNAIGAVMRFPSMIYSRESRRSIAKIIEDFRPDVAHCFAIYTKMTPSVLDELMIQKVPVVISLNDYKHICPNYKLFHHGRLCDDCKEGKFYRAVINRCCHNSTVYSVASSLEAYVHDWMDIYRKNIHTFLFASEFMASKTEEFWGKGTFRWSILKNPFDSIGYATAALHGVGGYAFYFGRIIDEKGVNVLLDAATLVSEVPLVVVGDGPDLERIRQVAASRELSHVQFLGAKWGDELDYLLRNCRYVVVPSLWHENFPYVILQAFAMGKPVIGSRRGGIPELVANNERGLVYEATDPVALSDAMRKLWGDIALVERLGLNAKQFVDHEFNDERFYGELMRIYNEVLQ
jgi:glycosyltransferase involved in cell wall biosynthesis